MVQAPAWLPYRVRTRWDHWRVLRAIAGIDGTPPVSAVPPASARAELHMLLCRRDVEIGVVAVKSLLRFRDVAWAVTMTDDGSVTEAQRRWIDRHVRGVRWLPRVATGARLSAALAGRPRLSALYESTYQPLRKLLHPAVLSECSKVLVLDPDTLFSRRPDRLIDWALRDEPSSLFLHDHQDERATVPDATRRAFAELHERVGIQRPWAMPYYFFNSGLLAYNTSQCDLDVAEAYLEWLEQAPPAYTQGVPGLWFGTWTPEQTAYQLIFATMSPAAEPFGDEYRIGKRPGFTFNHFLWLQLVAPSSLEMLRGAINEMGETATT
jgi:hypothetical protein